MPYQIGTDEAGYGPNLGPLTICGTAWRAESENQDIYEALSDTISADPNPKSKRIPICDSKKIYSSSRGIDTLETVVLAILFSLHKTIPKNLNSLLKLVSTVDDSRPQSSTSKSLFLKNSVPLPIGKNESKIKQLATHFSDACCRSGIALQAIDCRVIFPDQFNCLVEKLGNKAELLSSQTLDCVSQLSKPMTGNINVMCDKHGGRSKYSGLLNRYLTDQFIYVDCESRPISKYHWKKSKHLFEISFKSQGESFCPTALSSMIAKYVREVCMESWNGYWAKQVPGIKPTKGYPLDAKRFKKEISKRQLDLGIADDLIWRRC